MVAIVTVVLVMVITIVVVVVVNKYDHMGVYMFSSSRFDKKKELAENVSRPVAQNMLCPKGFIGGRQQGMGGGVRKADGGPKPYDL